MSVNFRGLDIQTIMIMTCIAVTLQLFMMIFLCLLVKHYPGVKTFTVGRAIALLGYSLAFIFSDIRSSSSMIGVGSCLLLLSSSVCSLGIAKFTGKTIKLRYVFFYNIVFICIQFGFILFNDRFIYKTIAQTIFQCILMLLNTYFLWRNQKPGFTESRNFLMIVYSCMGLVLFLRMVALIRHPPSNFFMPNETNSLSLIIVFIYTYLLTIGFIIMVCQRLYYNLKLSADTDELTGLLNRRAMMQLLHQAMKQYLQSGQSFALVLIDVDHFKGINDRYGHDGGDLVLIHLSQIFKNQSRSNDFCSRWGGEEFLMLLTNMTIDNAIEWSEKLRYYVEHTPTSSGIKITISLGVSMVNSYSDSVESLITAADHALYTAKRSGRNQVQLAIKH